MCSRTAAYYAVPVLIVALTIGMGCIFGLSYPEWARHDRAVATQCVYMDNRIVSSTINFGNGGGSITTTTTEYIPILDVICPAIRPDNATLQAFRMLYTDASWSSLSDVTMWLATLPPLHSNITIYYDRGSAASPVLFATLDLSSRVGWGIAILVVCCIVSIICVVTILSGILYSI